MSNPEKWRGFAPLPADIEARLAALPDWLAAQGVRLAYLFGSLAHTVAERPVPANDVDLALLLPPDDAVYRLHQPLCDELGIERLDLVDWRQASAELRFELLSTGRCLYAADEDERLEVELAALREYKDRAHWRRMHEELLRERLKQW